jgi:hypothetical protein
MCVGLVPTGYCAGVSQKDEPALLALDRSRARSGTIKLGEWAVT